MSPKIIPARIMAIPASTSSRRALSGAKDLKGSCAVAAVNDSGAAIQTFASLFRHNRSHFDLDSRFTLDEARDFNHGHRRVVPPNNFAVSCADLLRRVEILLLVHHIPGHASDVFRLGVRLRENFNDIVEGLPHLSGKVPGVELRMRVPPDHAAQEDHAPLRHHAIGVPFGTSPVRWLQKFHSLRHLLPATRANRPQAGIKNRAILARKSSGIGNDLWLLRSVNTRTTFPRTRSTLSGPESEISAP